jgi:hemoglobin-like flavoprotein
MALQVDLLEESFDLLAPRGEELVDVFYGRLFELDPSIEMLFGGAHMPSQKQKLLSTLVLLRKSLRDLPSIVPVLQGLGARHVEYGVKAEHYPLVGEALIGAMSQLAGDNWKPEYASAWADAYALIQQTMLDAAKVTHE